MAIVSQVSVVVIGPHVFNTRPSRLISLYLLQSHTFYMLYFLVFCRTESLVGRYLWGSVVCLFLTVLCLILLCIYKKYSSTKGTEKKPTAKPAVSDQKKKRNRKNKNKK